MHEALLRPVHIRRNGPQGLISGKRFQGFIATDATRKESDRQGRHRFLEDLTELGRPQIVPDDRETNCATPPALNEATVSCQNMPIFRSCTANQVLISNASFVRHINPKDSEPFRQFSKHGIRDVSAGFFHASEFRCF